MKVEPVVSIHHKGIALAPHRLALFGRPVKHSLSPQIHADFARQHGLAVEYRLIESTHESLAEDIQRFFANGGHGANVTVPFKGEAAALVDELSGTADVTQTVNTLSQSTKGGIFGHNTDGPGLIRDFRQRHAQKIHRQRILVIGAGGAAHGILPSLLAESPEQVTVANRSAASLEFLSGIFPFIDTAGLDTLSRLGPYDVVINATSLGHQQRSVSVHPKLFRGDSLAYDLNYGVSAEPFLYACRAAGARRLADGLGMLVEQAALSFALWFGLNVETESVYQRLQQG